MNPRTRLAALLTIAVLALAGPSCRGHRGRIDANSVWIDRPLWFSTSDGRPVLATEGYYAVTNPGHASLELTPSAGGPPLRVAARSETYAGQPASQRAILLPGSSPEKARLVYIFADGTCLAADATARSPAPAAGAGGPGSPIFIGGSPDLAITDLQAAPAAPGDGATIHFHGKVANTGTVPAAGVTVRFLVLGDRGGIVREETVSLPSALAPQAYASAEKRTPPLPVGTYRLRAEASCASATGELRVDNNAREIPLTVRRAAADLRVHKLELERGSRPVAPGETCRYVVEVENAGPAELPPGSFLVQVDHPFGLEIDARNPGLRRGWKVTASSREQTILEATHRGLAPGRSMATAVTVVVLGSSEGLELTARVDPQNAIPEADETNNCLGTLIPAEGLPNLKVHVVLPTPAPSPAGGAGPAPPAGGRGPCMGTLDRLPLDVRFEVMNVGTGTVPPGRIRVRLSPGTTAQADVDLVHRGLGAGARLEGRGRLGQGSPVLLVDPDNRIRETTEEDNSAWYCVAGGVSAPPAPPTDRDAPDITVRLLAPDPKAGTPSVEAGGTIDFALEVENLGGACSQNCAVEVALEGHDARTLEAGPLGHLEMKRLTGSLRATGTEGSAILRIVLDPRGLIREGNEGNNRLGVPVMVGRQSDLTVSILEPAPPRLLTPGALTVTFEVANEGPGDVPAPGDAISVSVVLEGHDAQEELIPRSELASGARVRRTRTLGVKSNQAPARLRIQVDSRAAVSESDERNNTAEADFAPPSSAPTARAGGPYEILQGENLALNGTAKDEDVTHGDYVASAWDLDDDGEADDFVGPAGLVPWGNLASLDLPRDEPIRITLAARDSTGRTATSTTTLTIRSR